MLLGSGSGASTRGTHLESTPRPAASPGPAAHPATRPGPVSGTAPSTGGTAARPLPPAAVPPQWARSGPLRRADAAGFPSLAVLFAEVRWLAARLRGEPPIEEPPVPPPGDPTERPSPIFARSSDRGLGREASPRHLAAARGELARGIGRSASPGAPGQTLLARSRLLAEPPRRAEARRRAETRRDVAPGIRDLRAEAPESPPAVRGAGSHPDAGQLGAESPPLSAESHHLSAPRAARRVSLRPAAALSRGAPSADHRPHRGHGRPGSERQSARTTELLTRGSPPAAEAPLNPPPGASPVVATPRASTPRGAPQQAPAVPRVELHPPRAQRAPEPPRRPVPPPQAPASARWSAPPQAEPRPTREPVAATPPASPRPAPPPPPAGQTERQLLAALRVLAGRSPEARALLREIRRQMDAAHHIDRLRRIG